MTPSKQSRSKHRLTGTLPIAVAEFPLSVIGAAGAWLMRSVVAIRLIDFSHCDGCRDTLSNFPARRFLLCLVQFDFDMRPARREGFYLQRSYFNPKDPTLAGENSFESV